MDTLLFVEEARRALAATGVQLGEIAPVSRGGAHIGAYSMSLALALTFGPWLGTQLLASTGPVGVWSAMFGLGALAAALMVYGAPHGRQFPAAVVAES